MHLPNVATLIVGHCIYAVTHAIGVLPPPNVQPAQPAFSLWTVLGDSFTAGPNAGQPVDPQSPNCYRTDGSWAYQLRRDPHFFNQNNLGGFQMHACTGDTIAQVREGQVDASNSGFTWLNDLYTITVGGNDLKFSSIVKSCVYNLPSIAGGGSCSGLLDAASQALKEGSPFLLDLDDLYNNIKDKAGARARLLVVPYVSFYNYGTEKHETKDNCWVPKDTRKRMDDITDQFNLALKQHAASQGWEILDADRLQSSFDGHRFCEPKTATGDAWFQDNLYKTLAPEDQQAFLDATDPSQVLPLSSRTTRACSIRTLQDTKPIMKMLSTTFGLLLEAP